MVDVLVGEEKETDGEQAGTSRQHNENENDSSADILFLRPRAKFVWRRGDDRQPGQGKNAQCKNVPCGN